MFEGNTIDAAGSWDEIAFVRSLDDEDTQDHYDDESTTSQVSPEEDLAGYLEEESVVTPYDAPDAHTLLAARTAVLKKEEEKLEKQFPFMEAAMAFALRDAARRKVKEVVPEIELELEDDEAPLTLDETWFEEAPKVEAKPVKESWFSRLRSAVSETLGNAVERFGQFLDTAVPVGTAAVVASTLGLGVHSIQTQTTDFEAIAPKISVQASTVELSQKTPEVKTVQKTQGELNEALVKNKLAIVAAAGGEKAAYLHSETSHKHLLAEMQKWGGFGRVLAHPKVKEAKTTAQMINLVETYFGDEVADLVESNAASMHQPRA